MKKRVLSLVLAVLIIVFSVRNSNAIVGYAVAAIVGASALMAVGSVLIPALVQGLDSKEAWVSLNVSLSNVASLAGSIGLAAIMADHTILKSAIAGFVGPTKGATLFSGSTVGYNVQSNSFPSGFNPVSGSTAYYRTSSAAAESAARAMGLAWVNLIYNGSTPWYWYAGDVDRVPHAYFFITPTIPPPNNTFTPYSSSDLGAELSTAAAAGDQAALNVIKAALTELDANMQGKSSKLAPGLVAAGKTILNNAVTQAQADTVAGVTPKTPEEIAAEAGTAALTAATMQAAMIAALAAQGLSAAQIQAAVAASLALNPSLTQAQVQAAMTAALVAAAPTLTAAQVQAAVDAAIKANPAIIPAYVPSTLPVAYVQPAVADFKTRTQAFIDTIKASSVFGLPVLMSSSIPSDSGSCEYTVDMSERFGGSKTVSFCNWATGLAAIHAVLMILAGWAAVRIVTKGGA